MASAQGFSSHTVHRAFRGLFSATFWASLGFFLVASLFKMAPSVELRHCLEFLSLRRLQQASWRK